MADSIPASPGSPEEFDFDDVEAFETLLDDNDEAEARRTTWETENYSALVDIEKRLDEAFSTPAQDNIPAQQGGGGWDRTNTVSTARLTPHHADDALVSLARRSSIRLSVRDLGMLGSTTQREDSPNDTGGGTSNLLSTTVARRTFLRSILGVTGASSSPGKRFRNAAASLMRSSRNTRESVCSDSITTPRGTSATSGGAAAGGASSGEGLPPMHNTPRTRTATAAIAERSLQDPTRFVDFVLGRLVRFTPTATGEATSPSTSSPLSPQSFVRVEDEEGGGVAQVLGNIAEAAKLIPVLANYSKRHAASVVPYLVKKGGALRRYIVPALIGLEQKFGVLDHRISNANGNLLMLLAHDSAEIFTANDIVLLIRLDKTQRKHFEEQEASSVDGKLLATVTVTQRSEASDAVGAEVAQAAAEGASGQEAAIGSDMRQTSVYNSPLLITEESAAVTTGGGAAAFTLQHPRMFRVEWIPPLLSIVCATKPARFLAPQVLVLASTLINDTLQSLVAAESVSTDVTAETVGDSSSPVSSSRLVPILSGARQLSSISSEFSSATYLVSTISNALAAVSDPDEALLASDNGSPENGGEVGENKREIKMLLSSNNIGTLFSLLLNITKFLSALAAVACNADRELRRNITNMSLADNFSSIPNWATIHAAASSSSGQALAIAASATSTMTSATDVDLDHKEGVTLSCCLSLASSLTAALESFSDAKKRRDDDDDSGVVDVFQHRKILTEMLLHSILSTHFFSCNNTNSSPSSTSPNSGSPLNSRSVMKSKMEIQSELHSSLKALLMIPMIMEAVECLDKTDTKVVASFLAEGFADGAMQVFQKTLGHDFAASTMIMAVPSALDQMATSRLQSIVPAICEDLAPYLLGLEQCAPIVGASPIDLVDASRQAKAALQTTAVTLSMFIAKFISSPTSHEVQSSSSQLPTHDDDVVMVGTPSKDPAARSRLNNSSNTNHNAVAREASFSVVRCVTILRSLHAAATDAPGVFVSSSESIQNMTWALQWMHYIQQQMAGVRRVAVDANVLHEALRSLHSRVMSLLITFSGTGQPAANDVMEGVVRLFSDRVQKRSDSESTASPCSVIVVAVLDLLQPEESIMTLSSAKPVVALALQLLVWFALSTTTTEQDDKDDDADDPLHDAKQKLSPWKFDGVQLADLLSIIALCDDGSSAACRKLAWKLVLHLVDDIFEDGVDANHRDAATKQRAAIGATDEDVHSAISSIELHFSDVACAAFPTSDVFASLVDMAPIMMMLHAHGLWPMKSNALSAKSTGGKKSKTTAELLSGITNKLVGTQRPGNKVSETLTIQCAAIVKILLDQVDSAFHSEWLTTVLRELRSCLSASSSEQEDAPLRVWPLTAVLCNTKMGEHWSSVAARSRSSDEKSAATTDRILLESVFLLRTNPSSEELLYVTTDDLDTLEGIIRAQQQQQQQQQSTPTVNNEASHRSVSPLQERDDTSIMDEASSPVMATVASPVSGATSPTAGRAGSTSKPPLRGDSPLTFVAFPSEPPIPSSGSATHPPEEVPFGAENSGKYRSSSPLVGGNVSDTSPRSFSSHTNAQDDNGRPASGGSRRRSKQFDNPQKMAEDLEALTKSLALKRYQLSEVTNKYNKAEALLQETRVALDNDTFHLEHVREAIECIDPDKYFSRDEVRRRQKVGDKSIKMLDLPLRKDVPLPAEHPPYDIKPASLAAKKSLDNLSDQFQRLMAAAVDTNDRNKLREAAATLTLERQLFEKEKLFYTKELDLAADIVWKKHSRIYELQLQADDLCRDADMYKKLQVDFRGLEENCTYLKNILDQYNMHLVAGTERAIILKRRRASSAHRVISTGRRTSNGNSTSPRELLAEEDSFEIGEDNDDGPVVVPPPAVSARNGSSSTLAPANGSRPSSAQATSRPSSALRPPLQHGDAAHNATSGTVTPSITPSGGAAPGASAAGQAKAWSEKMKLEFGLRSANTRIQRLQQEISKIIVERNAAILEAVDARQKTKFVELMHKSDVHGMAWAEQRIRRLEREKELYVNETRKANETLRETAEASQKKIEAMQTQLNKVEADRIQVVTTLALELDTARQRITELSGDCRRKDMMITQLTNKLELLRGGGGATKDNSTSPAYQPARAMSASPGRSLSVSRASVFGSPVSPIQPKHTSSSPLKKQSQPISQNSQMMPSGIAMSRNEGNNSMLENVIDKRQDPHLKNFFAWKDMQRHRRMKQR